MLGLRKVFGLYLQADVEKRLWNVLVTCRSNVEAFAPICRKQRQVPASACSMDRAPAPNGSYSLYNRVRESRQGGKSPSSAVVGLRQLTDQFMASVPREGGLNREQLPLHEPSLTSKTPMHMHSPRA
jgi:hypothetical protein